jgi:hypothetical protein
MNFYDVVTLLGGILQALGLLVFGAAAGWFTLMAYRKAEDRWQLQIAVYLGFFLFIALLARFSTPSGLGAFAFSAGAAMLYWGLRDGDAERDESIEGE